MGEYKQAEVTYKYYLPDHEHELKLHRLAHDFFSALYDIHNECRTVLKYGPPNGETLEAFAEKINTLCCESGMEDIE